MHGAERLCEGAAAIGVELPVEAARRLLELLDVLLELNERVNLTAIRDREEAKEKHLLDCVTAVRVWRPGGGERVLDVGTGGGLPGLALKAVAPDLEVVLLDGAKRKVEACRTLIERLGWEGARAVHARAEEWGRGEGREAYDVATARAVGHLAVVAELALPCVRVGGQVLAWKGRLSDEELDAGSRAARILGGEIAAVDRFVLPWSGAQRTMVRIEKRRPTPDRYPRRPGLPEKRPLGLEGQTRGEAENEGH